MRTEKGTKDFFFKKKLFWGKVGVGKWAQILPHLMRGKQSKLAIFGE
jgi:hypothetical protein